jgi:gamma-glutamylcyclotransferase (GGCT)/AIG2-like uncharacterized protein YtfP
MMLERLFVYGTLRPGCANAYLLEAIGGEWQAAAVTGALTTVGVPPAVYPALIPAENGARVAGFLFCSAQLAAHWAALDAFEGADYRRVTITATLADQSTVQAYVYALNDM